MNLPKYVDTLRLNVKPVAMRHVTKRAKRIIKMDDVLAFIIFGVIRVVVGFTLLIAWIVGIIIANGFWSTLFAIFIPLWSYYLVIERWLLPLLG